MSELSTVSGAVQAAADAVRKHGEGRAHTCPCCGQIIVPELELLALSPQKRRIYEIVKARMPYGIMAKALFAALHDADPNGGPETGPRTIHVLVCQLNKKLRPHGLRVASEQGRREAPYRIMAVDHD